VWIVDLSSYLDNCDGILHHRREVLVNRRQLQAAEVLSKLSTMSFNAGGGAVTNVNDQFDVVLASFLNLSYV
jgi:hypothetical protein